MLKKEIQVNKTLVYEKGRGCVFNTPKSNKSNRMIPITPELTNKLQAFKKAEKKRLKEFKKNSRIDNVTVIHNSKWKPCIPSDTSTKFTKFLKNNNLRHIRFHDLRHTHATLLLLDYNTKAVAVKDRLGHSRISTTINNYISGTSKQQMEGVSKLTSDIIGETDNNK